MFTAQGILLVVMGLFLLVLGKVSGVIASFILGIVLIGVGTALIGRKTVPFD